MRFDLHIDLSNAAMLNGADVARALREVATRVEHTLPGVIDEPEASRNIQDANGNTVGWWEVSEGDV